MVSGSGIWLTAKVYINECINAQFYNECCKSFFREKRDVFFITFKLLLWIPMYLPMLKMLTDYPRA